MFENLELAMKADKRVRSTLFARLASEERDRIGETLKLDPPRPSAARSRRRAAVARAEAVARDRHAADAGAASCCCSTSRSPA